MCTSILPDLPRVLVEWGLRETYPHLAAGGAVAFAAPWACTKQAASSSGGSRNDMLVHRPKGIRTQDGLRRRFHVTDMTPTIREAVKRPELTVVNGTPPIPMPEVSMAYAVRTAGRCTGSDPGAGH